ncbi:MAG: hypothetical protein FWF45_07985 [Coriobacteriia bacterium]|nr:hypothetical protein [Coriobacteriia bacterium]
MSMDLYDEIERRKSCRKFSDEPLSEEQLQEVEVALQGFDLLYPEVTLKHRLATEVKGMFVVRAPHYLIVSGQGKPHELESAGFLFEQLILWFSAQGLGCVWQGGAKSADKDVSGNDLIIIAFGAPKKPPYRQLIEFDRKAIDDITNAPNDPCIQAVHLAPSGMNLQPWYLEQTRNEVLLYKQKISAPQGLLYKLADLDLGIALCHYMLACKHLGKSFSFEGSTDLPAKKGCQPFGVITSEG